MFFFSCWWGDLGFGVFGVGVSPEQKAQPIGKMVELFLVMYVVKGKVPNN